MIETICVVLAIGLIAFILLFRSADNAFAKSEEAGKDAKYWISYWERRCKYLESRCEKLAAEISHKKDKK